MNLPPSWRQGAGRRHHHLHVALQAAPRGPRRGLPRVALARPPARAASPGPTPGLLPDSASTPACRAARAASDERYDEADHLQSYFFYGSLGHGQLQRLERRPERCLLGPLGAPAGRARPVDRLDGIVAAPRIKVGADVLLWWSAKGVYFMIERGGAPVADLLDVPGVGGAWSGGAEPMEPPFCTRDNSGLHVSYLFLDDEPAEVAMRLRPRLEQRWSGTGNEPLLAAPFHSLVAYEWDRSGPDPPSHIRELGRMPMTPRTSDSTDE